MRGRAGEGRRGIGVGGARLGLIRVREEGWGMAGRGGRQKGGDVLDE